MRRVLCRNVLLPVSIWFAFFQGVACAYLTDGNTYAPVNYSIFVPPEAGESYIDPVFGTTIKRISNSRMTPNAGDRGNLPFITHEYSTISPFNGDNSKMLLQHYSYFALYDGTGKYIRDLPFEIHASSEPRWSRRDPNVVYYIRGNELRQYNAVTGVIAAVHTFSEYGSVRGYGESDISEDGDHVVLVGDNRYIFVYEISTDTKGGVFDTAGLGGFDNVHITASSNILVSWYARGNGRYNGVELYDRNMNFQRQVSRAIGHMDVTRDTDGEEVLLWVNADDPLPICQNGLMKIRLWDGHQTCLISFDWSLAQHVSAPDTGGWVFISTHAPTNPSPDQDWKRYTSEILQVKLDGSEVRRLAHHRSRPYSSSPYWWMPRASVSRDGSRLMYSSNFGLQTSLSYPDEYGDVYLIDLSATAPSPAGSEHSVGRRFEEIHSGVRYTGGWYTHGHAAHSGGRAVLAMEPGARAAFTFTGTAVSWIGYRDEWSGIAHVYVDGELHAEIDTYASPWKAQSLTYTISGLPAGTHTLTIEATGRRHPASGGAWVWVDGFEVLP